jgi:hypothetical protein
VGTVTPITVIGERIPGEAIKVRQELEGLLQNLTKKTFDIGTLLHRIKKEGLYTGFTTFQDYVATLDIKPRKALYLRKIAEVMELLGIEREEYEPVGISKLREITSLNPYETWTNPETGQEIQLSVPIMEMIEHHKELSLDTIKKTVKVFKGLVGDQEMVSRHFWVPAIVAQEVIDPAVELARKQIGSVHRDDEGVAQDAKDGACYENICVNFLQDPANAILAGEG